MRYRRAKIAGATYFSTVVTEPLGLPEFSVADSPYRAMRPIFEFLGNRA